MGLFTNKRAKELTAIAEQQMQDIAELKVKNNELAGKIGLLSLVQPVELWEEDQTKQFKSFLVQLDMMQNVEYVADVNLDGTDIDRYEFARFVYRHGCVMVVYDKENNKWFYGKPKAQSWDTANNIKECTLILQRYDEVADCYEDYPGKIYQRGDYFLYYDTMPAAQGVPCLPRMSYNEVILNQMAEIFARMNINITLATNKLIFEANDVDTHNILKQELKKEYGSKSPFIVTDKQRFGNQKMSETPAQSALTELFALIKQYDQIRQMYNGIGQGQYGIDKAERNLADEVSVNTDSVDFCHRYRDNQKQMLSIWIKMVNEKVMQSVLEQQKETQESTNNG